MAPPLKVYVGQTLDARFLLLEEIGHGGMSTIFKAEDLKHNRRHVAVKVPLPQYASGLGSWSMFQREGEIGAQLCHPNILSFVELSSHESRGYIVTEFVAGATLSSLVGRGRRLPEAEALRIMSRLCDAVDYLHRKRFVHYDLKPDNVMLGDESQVVLIDFGMAHRAVTSRFTLSAAAPPIASSDYVAPEQLRRKRGRVSVDVYALGAILYEMLTGHAPFEGDDPFVAASARQIGDPLPPRALNPAISKQVEEIVLRALRRNPTERYLSVDQLKSDLDQPSQVYVTGLAERLVPVTPGRRRLRLLRFIALITLTPIAILATSFRLLWWYLEKP